jgi:hypothetical protein
MSAAENKDVEIAYQRAHQNCPLCGGIRPASKMTVALESGPYIAVPKVQTIRRGKGRISWDVADLGEEEYAGLLVMMLEYLKQAVDAYEDELRDLSWDARENHKSPFEDGTAEDAAYLERAVRGRALLELDDDEEGRPDLSTGPAVRGAATLERAGGVVRGPARTDGAGMIVQGAAALERDDGYEERTVRGRAHLEEAV